MTSTTLVGRSSLEAEELLLARLDEELDAAAAEVAAGEGPGWSPPVRVVVPSTSLRLHVADALARRRGRACAGVVFHTLRGYAVQALLESGRSPRSARAVFETLVAREAESEPALAAILRRGEAAPAAIAASVRDLLDAGLDEDTLEPALECATDDALRPQGAAADRAAALARVAVALSDRLHDADLHAPSDVLREAAEIVASRDDVLPARATFVHGFADATGRATDLLDALLRRPGGTLILGAPRDPARHDAPDTGLAHARRFAERLAPGIPRREEWSGLGAAPTSPVLAAFRAPGATAEAREIAVRVRALLDDGARPESIGIVARSLPASLARTLGRQLERLAVPFSSLGAPGPVEPAGRRRRALARLIDRGGAASVEDWIACLRVVEGSGKRFVIGPRLAAELRLGLHRVGVARVGEVAVLDPSRVLEDDDRLPLPVRCGFTRRDEGDAPAVVAPRRKVPGDLLRAAVDAARRWLEARDALVAETARARVLGGEAGAVRMLRRALRDALGWSLRPLDTREESAREGGASTREGGPNAREGGPSTREGGPSTREGGSNARGCVPSAWRRAEASLAQTLTALGEDARAVELRPAELRRLLVAELGEGGRGALGGAGAGVALLDAVEARGRTFEHLFLLALNRDVFPRTVREDPLLPDRVRAALAAVLPDLALEREGHDEERYLFAQAISSASRVTLSWQTLDEDGRPRPPSPLVQRLLLEREADGEPVACESVAHPHARPPAARLGDPRPADEAALLAGLFARRARVRDLLPAALEEGWRERGGASEGASPTGLRLADVASGRLALLDELDPDRGEREGRARSEADGPFLGHAGRVVEAALDPRCGSVPVTTLESHARCPWQTLLTRVLKVEPQPDPAGVLPSLDRRLVGSVVHEVLERAVAGALPHEAKTLADALDHGASEVSLPPRESLRSLVAETIDAEAAETGLALGAARPALVEACLDAIDVVREIEWTKPRRVLGVELTGAIDVALPDGSWGALSFKADRVDAGASGLDLVDYKTGRPVSDAAQAKTRLRHWRAAIAGGTRLQAAAYSAAGGEGGVGRLLFVGADVDRDCREVSVDASNDEGAALLAVFRRSAGVLLDAWRRGVAAPRLAEPDQWAKPGPACGWCSVKAACLREDSGFRGRFEQRLRALQHAEDVSEDDESLRTLWWLSKLDSGDDS